jgi:hypothetical protein
MNVRRSIIERGSPARLRTTALPPATSDPMIKGRATARRLLASAAEDAADRFTPLPA